MLIAATFALAPEFASWRRLRLFRRRTDGSLPVYETRVGRVDLRVVLTGIGQRAAAAAAPTVFQDRPDVCIASGMAGALAEGLRVGDVIAAARVRDPDGLRIDGDSRLLTLAVRRGARTVNLYSSPIVVGSAREKRRMSEMADAVDMETAVILAESRRLGIPGIAVRGISDLAAVDMPLDFNQAITDEGRLSGVRVMAALARRPRAVPALVRLGIDGRRAAAALAAFLDAYVEQLAVDWIVEPGQTGGVRTTTCAKP